MLSYIVHILLVCIVGYLVFNAVHQSKKENSGDFEFFGEDENRLVNVTNFPIEDLIFEQNLELKNVIPEPELSGTVIDDRYVVGELIARGNIAMIRSGLDEATERDVVIKFVEPGLKTDFLHNEFENYLQLGAEDEEVMKHGIPNVMYFGEHGGYHVMVMQMVGPTLRDIKMFSKNKKFSGKSILKIAIQLMNTFEYIHSRGLVVRDITSSHIAIGNSKETMNKLFVFDFANSGEISDEFSTTDDLLLVGLYLLELNGVDFPDRSGSDDNEEMSIDHAIESLIDDWDEDYLKELCGESDLPEIFQKYFQTLASIEDEKSPDYEALKKIFTEGLSADELKKNNLGLFESSK